MRRLVCAFVVRKPPKTGFLASRPILCSKTAYFRSSDYPSSKSWWITLIAPLSPLISACSWSMALPENVRLIWRQQTCQIVTFERRLDACVLRITYILDEQEAIMHSYIVVGKGKVSLHRALDSKSKIGLYECFNKKGSQSLSNILRP